MGVAMQSCTCTLLAVNTNLPNLLGGIREATQTCLFAKDERMDMARNIHQRMLILRDAALGSRNTVTVNSTLASASYDCAVDSLLALHAECSKGNLTRDKNIARFLYKRKQISSSEGDICLCEHKR